MGCDALMASEHPWHAARAGATRAIGTALTHHDLFTGLQAFEHLGLHPVVQSHLDLARAHLRLLAFAFEHPQTYKLMFDLNQPHEKVYPDLVAAAARANAMQSAYIRGLVESGFMQGDPEEIGRMYWAATHGAVTLELAGKLPGGAARTLSRQLGQTLAKGLRPGA